jgi:hypothetical protein
MKQFLTLMFAVACLSSMAAQPSNSLVEKIKTNSTYPLIVEKAKTVMKTGFNAGDGYGEVWIRDYNTFIDLACDVYDPAAIKENLLAFFNLQGTDGNIVDGFIPKGKAGVGYDYIYTKLEPRYAGHKNTVETDQETSLIQAIYKYVKHTGKKDILTEKVGDKTVGFCMEEAMEYLLNHRYSARYGLIWGATTADWGDVQPEHEWGVYLTSETHYAIDIYDNAMFIIALDNMMELMPETAVRWKSIRDGIAKNARKYLWDGKRQKFIPHIYLNGSPFSPSLDENAIFYHGGTAVAIEAGLLSKAEIKISLDKMIQNVKASGAVSIGLTMYPPYPQGAFMGKGMYPYGYQNGGDWTWFGARMIQQLVRYGFVKEAYEQLQPMVDRVKANNGFYEWYSVDNKPSGSGTFRGEAGVLYKSIDMLYDWANKVK